MAFVHGLVNGSFKPPQKQRLAKNWTRKSYFYIWSQTIENKFNLNPTRNVSSQKRMSVCDAIVQGLEVNGRHTSYQAIFDIYKANKPENAKLKTQIEQIRIAADELRTRSQTGLYKFLTPNSESGV